MAAHSPKVLVPLKIVEAMLVSSSIAEPAATETVWSASGTYVVGDVRIRLQTHRRYKCTLAHTAVTTPPESDTTHWTDDSPTSKWAMFDAKTSTATCATSSLSVVLSPGFFNAIALYNLSGDRIDVTVKDAPGGNVLYSYSGVLHGPYVDEYDYCFGPVRENTKLVLSGIPLSPLAEMTITVSASEGTSVGIGMLCVGDMRDLLIGNWGGVEHGATVELVDFSYIKTDDFGDATIKKRRSASDMAISVVLPKDDADYALSCVQEVLATPAAWVATTAAGYAGLNVFGTGSGSLVYAGPCYATLNIKVKGLI